MIYPWSDTLPYLVFNLRSPDSGDAVQKQLVRAAVETGLDKTAVVKAYGGPDVGKIINTVIPPGNVGYQNTNLYPDNNGTGDSATCKSDLSKAGYPHGLTVTYMYPNDSANTRAFTAIQASLANCGITLTGKGEPGSSFFVDMGNAPENNKPGTWDIGQVGWIPDWYGDNGRTIVQAAVPGPELRDQHRELRLLRQLDGELPDHPGRGGDHRCPRPGLTWHAADEQIMKDADDRAHHEPDVPADRQQAGPWRPAHWRHVPDGDLRAEHRRPRHHQRLAGAADPGRSVGGAVARPRIIRSPAGPARRL